jgi:PAS domain S-box-containing protein
MGHPLSQSDGSSSLVAFILITMIGVASLVLLPRGDKRSQLLWIVPCTVLSLFEAVTDNIPLSRLGGATAAFLATVIVSVVLSERAQADESRRVPRPASWLACVTFSAIAQISPLLALAGSAEIALSAGSFIVACCWPMLVHERTSSASPHYDGEYLSALLLAYGFLVLTPQLETGEPNTALEEAEALIPFVGVVIGFVASTLALRRAFRDNARLMRAERAARAAKEQSAKFLRALIDTFPAAVYVKDLQGRYQLVNTLAAQWYGRTESEIIGRGDFDLLPPAIAQALREHDDLVIATGRQHDKDWELRCAPDAEPRSMRSHKFPLFGPDGNVRLIAGLAMDVTTIKEHERALEAARFKAEEANCAKSNFLAHMSHELRTPLNAIIGFSDIIHSSALGPVGNDLYRQYAGDIKGAGHLLLSQVEDLLDIAQFDSDGGDVALQPLDLALMIADCCHLLRGPAERKRITLDIDRVRSLPKVQGDMRATTQVLANLIGGAIRSLPSGSTVTIAGGRTESGAPYLLIEDNGPQQTTQDLQALMDPWTFRPATKAEDGRGGLGLLLARRLMEAQGGRLVVENSPRSGTRIACQFALSQEPADRAFGS